METVFIYTLEDPITGEIRYVGKTRNPKMRFHNHCNRLHNEKSHKRNWINKLKKIGKKPIMNILDEVLESEWKYWEKFWINQLRVWEFNLVNHTSGGDGLTMGNSTSFKKGHKSWNKGTAKPKIKKGFNNKCLETSFKKGHKSWNKGLSVHLKPKKTIFQYSSITGIFIKEWINAKQVTLELNINEDSIGNCARNISKSAGGYIWKYEKFDYVTPVVYKGKTNNKIKNNLK